MAERTWNPRRGAKPGKTLMAKPKSKNKLQLVMGFVLLGAIALLAYWTVATIWNALSATPTIGAGIAAAALTGALAILSTFLTKHLDRKATVVAQLREKKIPVYEEIIRLVFGIALAGKGGKAPLKEQDIVRQMADITEKLTIWGSDELVEAYYKFRMASIRQAAGGSQDPREALIALTDLMLAVRRDLGHKNKNISRRKILGLFVNDVPDDIT